MPRFTALIKTIALEIWGLFVDDAVFAGAVVVWLVVAAVTLRPFVHTSWAAPWFFIGLALILAGGVFRQARKTK